MQKRIHVISHAKCFDGSAAAWSVWKALDTEMLSQIVYHFMSYHDTLPEIADGDEVVMVDFFQKEALVLPERGCSLTILDHHETSMIQALQQILQNGSPDEVFPIGFLERTDADRKWRFEFPLMTHEEIEDWLDKNPQWAGFSYFPSDRMQIEFDMRQSGALLAWDFFHYLGVSDFLRYIDDRDRWVWELPFSEEVSEGLAASLFREFRPRRRQQQLYETALGLYEASDPEDQLTKFLGFRSDDPSALLPPTLLASCEALLQENYDAQAEAIAEFEFFSQLAQQPDYASRMATTGMPLVVERRRLVDEICDQAGWATILGHQVPIVQSQREKSWVGHALCHRNPTAPFAVVWQELEDGIIGFELRGGKMRCNRIARSFGGGGHKPAAGFALHRLDKLRPGDRFRWIDWDPAGGNMNLPEPDSNICEMKSDTEHLHQRWVVKLK